MNPAVAATTLGQRAYRSRYRRPGSPFRLRPSLSWLCVVALEQRFDPGLDCAPFGGEMEMIAQRIVAHFLDSAVLSDDWIGRALQEDEREA